MVKEAPPKGSIEKFWKGISGEKSACNIYASWIENTEKENEKVKEQKWENIILLRTEGNIDQVLEMKITWN